LPKVRRLIGNFASNCFSPIKPCSSLMQHQSRPKPKTEQTFTSAG
jgi:hypothetical protein